MLFWFVVICVMAVAGSLGKMMGPIRTVIALIGVVTGAVLAFKVGPGLHTVLANNGVTSPALVWLTIPIALFVVPIILFNAIGQVVHMKVANYYRYKAEDDDRMMWEKMMEQTGLCAGLLAGMVYCLVIGLTVYILGYITLQVESNKENSWPAATINILCGGNSKHTLGLKNSGLDRVVAAFDPTPSKYYDFADVLGLAYNNPDVGHRLAEYPGLSGLAEHPEIKKLVADQQFQTLLASHDDFNLMLRHPKVQALLKDEAIMAELKGLDLADLKQFIETGKTEKFKDNRLLGVWEIYVPSTVNQIKQKNPQITITDMARLKKAMAAVANGVTMTATANGQIFVKSTLGTPKPLLDMMTGRLPQGATNGPSHQVIMQGTWKKVDKEYVLTFKGPNNQDQSEGAAIVGRDNLEVLTTSFFGGGLVMVKAD